MHVSDRNSRQTGEQHQRSSRTVFKVPSAETDSKLRGSAGGRTPRIRSACSRMRVASGAGVSGAGRTSDSTCSRAGVRVVDHRQAPSTSGSSTGAKVAEQDRVLDRWLLAHCAPCRSWQLRFDADVRQGILLRCTCRSIICMHRVATRSAALAGGARSDLELGRVPPGARRERRHCPSFANAAEQTREAGSGLM